MRWLLLVALFAGAVLGAEEDVVVLTEGNFDEMIGKNSAALVEFYAPWCGHCKKLAPEYAEAAGAMKGKEVMVAKVDATQEKALGERFGIEGYPTLKFFRDGKPVDYDGGRSAKDIISYLTKQTSPPVQPLLTGADYDEFLPESEDDDVVLVAFTAADSELGTFFHAFAGSHRMQYTFGAVTDEAVAKEKGEAFNTIVLHKPFDEKKVLYTGENTEEELAAFLSGNALPLLGAIGPGNYAKYTERKLPLLWLFVDKEEASDAAKGELQSVAGDFKGKVSMVYLDGPQYARWAGSMGVSGKKWPAMATQSSEGLNFAWNEENEIKGEAVKTWLSGVLDGSVKPTIKSEPIPDPPHDSDNVRIVVADNFDEVVMDKTKDVMIEFYAPWCGHCKSLAPKWAQLATQMKDEASVVIAKMDATANDAPPAMKVKGFPTLKLVTAEDNEVLDYNGARETESILDFIRSKGKAAKNE